MSAPSSAWLCCPHCGDDSQIDILATVWVRATPTGAEELDTFEFGGGSMTSCVSCGHFANMSEFQVSCDEDVMA